MQRTNARDLHNRWGIDGPAPGSSRSKKASINTNPDRVLTSSNTGVVQSECNCAVCTLGRLYTPTLSSISATERW